MYASPPCTTTAAAAVSCHLFLRKHRQLIEMKSYDPLLPQRRDWIELLAPRVLRGDSRAARQLTQVLFSSDTKRRRFSASGGLPRAQHDL